MAESTAEVGERSTKQVLQITCRSACRHLGRGLAGVMVHGRTGYEAEDTIQGQGTAR